MPTFNGTDGDDTLVGTREDDVIHGLGGNDVLRSGGGGRDQIFGDVGDDVFVWGRDEYNLVRFDGGDGVDTLDLTQFIIAGGPQSVSFMSVECGDTDQTIRVNIGARGPNGPYSTTVIVEATNIERLLVNSQISVNLTGYARPIEVVGAAPPVVRSIVGTHEADRLVGDTRNDAIFGEGGDDFLIGDAGNDQLNGGAGIDTAGYYSLMRSYVVTRDSGGVVGIRGGVEGGADTLTSLERLSFLDGTLFTDSDSPAARLYRLYDAMYDRAPDQAGLSGWMGRLASGTSLAEVAQAFATGPEVVANFGSLSNTHFVLQLYRNALNREADHAGAAAWIFMLDQGASRGSILTAFAESAEHRAITAAAVTAGIFVQDERTLAVARLFDAAFDRLPDREGIAYWRGTLETGGSLFSIANAFVSSQEFQDRYGALSNRQFIEQLYRFTLNREADALGLQTWTDRLNAGTTRAEMVVIFSESAEHVALTAPLWQGGVRYLGGPMTGALEDVGAKAPEALGLPDLFDDIGGLADGSGFVGGEDDVFDVDDIPAAFIPAADLLSSGHPYTDWI